MINTINHTLRGLLVLAFFSLVLPISAQTVVIDPGHGLNSSGGNPDGRSLTEIRTALSVGLKLRDLLRNECSNLKVYMTRTEERGWITLSQRRNMSNSWGADRFLSIHCNAGGGTGSEGFWCNQGNAPVNSSIAFARETQKQLVSYGEWRDRRTVEDEPFLSFHLGVLRDNNASATLSEIGFVDSPDSKKLNDDGWRNRFAKAYQVALSNNLGRPCNENSCPSSRNFSATITAGVYQSSGDIIASAALGKNVVATFDAKTRVLLTPGFSALGSNGNKFAAKVGVGCSNGNANLMGSSPASPEVSSFEQSTLMIEDTSPTIYPNPSDGLITIDYFLEQTATVNIRIYNAIGYLVGEPLPSTEQNEGGHTVQWNKMTNPPGVYFCLFEGGGETVTRKILFE